MPLRDILVFVRSRLPPNTHFWLTPNQLRLLAIKMLNEEGYLTSRDSAIFNTPYFGQIYASEGGNTLQSVERLFIDFIPGLGYLSLFNR